MRYIEIKENRQLNEFGLSDILSKFKNTKTSDQKKDVQTSKNTQTPNKLNDQFENPLVKNWFEIKNNINDKIKSFENKNSDMFKQFVNDLKVFSDYMEKSFEFLNTKNGSGFLNVGKQAGQYYTNLGRKYFHKTSGTIAPKKYSEFDTISEQNFYNEINKTLQPFLKTFQNTIEQVRRSGI